jgi:hypothetical protein
MTLIERGAVEIELSRLRGCLRRRAERRLALGKSGADRRGDGDGIAVTVDMQIEGRRTSSDQMIV